MKTYDIELQRVKAMSHGNGLILAQVDALVLPARTPDDKTPTTSLAMTPDTARVLQALLKTQLAELDRRKGRSQR